jgi:hypothetical protein
LISGLIQTLRSPRTLRKKDAGQGQYPDPLCDLCDLGRENLVSATSEKIKVLEKKELQRL